MEPLRLHATPDDAGQRLDQALRRHFPARSRTQLKAWIDDARVTVNGAVERPSYIVAAGDLLEVTEPEPVPATLEPISASLSVLFEDDDLVVIDKPAGLLMHPGAGAPRATLAHALVARYPGWVPPGSAERPGIVHRLDLHTSGLVVVARSPAAYQGLVQQIQKRELKRRYIALVWGGPAGEGGRIDAPLGRDPRDRRRFVVRPDGRPALTHWRVLARYRDLTLLELRLSTGRTHQIRVHLRHLGHPIFGDPVYGEARSWLDRLLPARRTRLGALGRSLNRQALHAYHLALRHPVRGGRLRLETPVPRDLDQVLLELCSEEASA